MYRTRLVGMLSFLLIPQMASGLGQDVRRVTPANRPYIVEIGNPEPLTSHQLERERQRNEDLRIWLNLYGWPDYAERQEIEPFYPWYDYEVRLYYLDRNIELAFGRANVETDVADLGSIKYRGYMDTGTHDRIVALVGEPQIEPEPQPVAFEPVREPEPATDVVQVPPDAIEQMILRIEAAAERASQAADNAAAASERANLAADRTVNVLEKFAQ